MQPSSPRPENLAWRGALESDRDWTFALQREAMGPHVARIWGPWDDAKQRQIFDDRTRMAALEIACLDDRRVGCRWVRRHDDHVELVRLYLASEVRERGLGTALVRALVDEAHAEGQPVRLRVLRGNRAKRLYERLGFVATEVTDTHTHMEARPEGSADPSSET